MISQIDRIGGDRRLQRSVWRTVLLADRSSFEDYDLEAAQTHGFGFARIQRYAIEHLLGSADPDRRNSWESRADQQISHAQTG